MRSAALFLVPLCIVVACGTPAGRAVESFDASPGSPAPVPAVPPVVDAGAADAPEGGCHAWKLGPIVTLTDQLGRRSSPSIASTRAPSPSAPAGEFGVVWEEQSGACGDGGVVDAGAACVMNIRFMRLDALGNVLSPTVFVTGSSRVGRSPALAASTNEYGLAWIDNRLGSFAPYFRRLSSEGTPLGQERLVESGAGAARTPSVVSTGSGYGLTWHAANTIAFAWLDASGNREGDAWTLPEITPRAAKKPSVAWTGSSFFVAWQDERESSLTSTNDEVFSREVYAAPGQIGAERRLTTAPGFSWNPSVAWTGDGYALAWQDDRDDNSEIYVQALDRSGAPLSAARRWTEKSGNSWYPNIAWTGTLATFVWQDGSRGSYDVYLGTTDATATHVTDDLRLNDGDVDATLPKIAWSGQTLGVVWQEGPAESAQIRFRAASCTADH